MGILTTFNEITNLSGQPCCKSIGISIAIVYTAHISKNHNWNAMSTKDKIIQTSITLFNQHGERAITTNHIAAEMGISPGNLYYHFKNKEDILRHIYGLYREHLVTHFSPMDKNENVLSQLAGYLDALVELMWKFNFLYSNLADILSRDKVLKAQYIEQQAQLVEQIIGVIDGLQHANVIDIDEHDKEELAHMVKLTVSFWAPYVKAHQIDDQLEKQDIYGGIIKVIMLFKPYARGEGLVQLQQLQQEYRARFESTQQQVA